MRIGFSLSGPSIRAQADELGRTLAKAVTVAVAAATDGAKEEMRRQVGGYAGAFGKGRMGRVQNAIRAETFPRPPRYSPAAAGRVFAKGEQAERIFSAFSTGPYITPRRARALAIPLHQFRDINGKLLGPTSSYWGGRLVYVPSRGRRGVSVGVLALPIGGTASKQRRQRNTKARRAISAALDRKLAPQFILVKSVQHPKLLTPEATMQRWSREVPALITQALSRLNAGPA